MKLKEFFEFAVKEGVKLDPRGKKGVEKKLKKLKEEYNKLKPEEKKLFDKERLWNPFDDSRILNGTGQEKVKTVLVGIDMEVGELLLADRLKEKGKKIDLVLAHHPEGKALAGLYSVMDLQEDLLNKFGVPINQAESIMKPRIEEVRRKLNALNHTRASDAAKLLGLPMANFHTPSDNHVTSFLQKFLDKKKPERLKDLIDLLKAIPEYKTAVLERAGPTIFVGKPENRCGKIYVNMTGGTEGPKETYEKLAAAGMGTTVEMHVNEDNRKAAEKHNINIVIAGHMSSDNLGLNLILDKAEKRFGKLNIIECSGFRRFKHGRI